MSDTDFAQIPFIKKVEEYAESIAAFLTIFAASVIFLGVILRNVFKTSPSLRYDNLN